MWNRTAALGLLLTTAIAAASVERARISIRSRRSTSSTGAAYDQSHPAASPVDALNRCIQRRFQTIDGTGMARIPVIHRRVRKFDPRSPEEKTAVAELRRQGWTVGLYLGGLGLLDPPMTRTEWEATHDDSARRAIREPILVSGGSNPASLPGPWDLWEIGQRALVSSRTSDSYQASFGRWSVDARPVRAVQAKCLKCHGAGEAVVHGPIDAHNETELKLGDALGVLTYVYARDHGVR